MNKPNYYIRLITKLQQLDGELKTELNIGLEETLGELIGENLDSLESKCTETTWQLRKIALGVPLKPNLILLTWTRKNRKLKFWKFEHMIDEDENENEHEHEHKNT